MKSWAAGLSILTGLSCLPLAAQQQASHCSTSPPEHSLDRAGNVIPEARDWDPDACIIANPAPAVPAVISVRTLAHKPPKAARQEFDRGVRAWEKNKNEEALRHLREAVRLDPGFLEADIELGAVYADAGQPAVGLDYFNRALSLEPNSVQAHTEKAAALVALNRPAEAEPVARLVLQLAPGSIAAHYLLGVSLIMQQKLTPEATNNLKLAAGRYPKARTFLAAVETALAGQAAGK